MLLVLEVLLVPQVPLVPLGPEVPLLGTLGAFRPEVPLVLRCPGVSLPLVHFVSKAPWFLWCLKCL